MSDLSSETESKLLQLSKAAGDNTNLPSLGSPESAWAKYLQELQQKLTDFLNSLFNIKSTAPDLSWVLPTIKFIFYVGVFLLIAYLVYRLLDRKRAPIVKGSGRFQRSETPSDLEHQLATALSSARYAEAARIRWKIWLLRTRRPLNGTPGELLASEKDFADRAMFASEQGSAELYQEVVRRTGDPSQKGFASDRTVFAILIGGFVVYFLLNFLVSYSSTQQTVSTGVKGSMNIGTLAKAAPETSRLRSALLYPEQLKPGQSVILLLSPRVSPSQREAALFLQAVKDGSDLVMSFHNEEGYQAILRLIQKLEINAPLLQKEDPKFVDRQSEEVTMIAKAWPWQTGETYHFYSRLIFDDITCTLDRFYCFVRTFKVGNGRVIVIAGVPPFSASLLNRGDNIKIAARLIDDRKELLIDEYHQLFSDRTLWDLLMQSYFSIPLGSLLIGLFLYYLFGGNPNPKAAAPRLSVESYHSFSRRLLTSTIQGRVNESIAIQKRLLSRLISRQRAGAGELASAKLEQANSTASLLKFHQDFIRNKKLKRGSDVSSANL